MKVPFSWLKEYVDIDVTAQSPEEKLFSCGFEVEELIPLDAGYSKVVVGDRGDGKAGRHPPPLTKCVVDCGDYGHDIRHASTGAANMKTGRLGLPALDGSTLPGGVSRQGPARWCGIQRGAAAPR